MSGAVDIRELLAGMTPTLDETADYIFLTVSAETVSGGGDKAVAVYLQLILLSPAVGFFQEEEGFTVILPECYLTAQLTSGGDGSDIPAAIRAEWAPLLAERPLPRMKRITMRIHSSLTAVGFTAAFSKVLGEAGISCNVVAAHYHDHIFVPSEKAGAAMAALRGLSSATV